MSSHVPGQLPALPGGTERPSQLIQIPPINDLWCPAARVEYEQGPPVPSAVMTDCGNVSGELVALGGDIRAGLGGSVVSQSLRHPGHGGQLVGMGLSIRDKRLRIVHPNAGQTSQDRGGSGIHVNQALDVRVSAHGQRVRNLSELIGGHPTTDVELENTGKRRVSSKLL